MLIIFGGLPGSGKTTLARELARRTGAFHLRIDLIEQAMRNCGRMQAPLDGAGYHVAYALAEDNMRNGHSVIADSVNSLQATRDAWLEVAHRAGVKAVEIEIQCSDAQEHRRRVESRATDIEGLRLPTWQEILSREYHPWIREPIVIDTAGRSVEQSIAALQAALASRICR